LEPTLLSRVGELEDLLSELLRAQARSQVLIDQIAREGRADRTRSRTEMREFKAEMQAFRERAEADRIAMNRKWGELANKMGTMAEDLVAPSIPRILRTVVGCPEDRIDLVAVRVRKRHSTDAGRSQEFDVVAACGEYVLINETKSSLNTQDVDDFVRLMSAAREFFSEYEKQRFIGAIASLYVDVSLARYGEKRGVIVLGFGEDVMEVLNSPGFEPQEF